MPLQEQTTLGTLRLSIGKSTWWNSYLKAGDEVFKALKMLSQTSNVTEAPLTTVAKFVCTALTEGKLRRHLFCKHLAEGVKIPLTLGALKQHVLKVHIEARVRSQAHIAQQEFLNPLNNGYYKDEDGQLKQMSLSQQSLRWSDVTAKQTVT